MKKTTHRRTDALTHGKARLVWLRRAARYAAVFCASVPLCVSASPLAAQTTDGGEQYVVAAAGSGRFTLARAGQAAPMVASSADYPGVLRAVRSLRTDLSRVTSAEPALSLDALPGAREVVVIGTLGRNTFIDGLVRSGRLDTTGLAGRWETFVVQTVNRPWPGVDRALVIAGSDKRGTIYGAYEVSAQIGVSPWTFWADVPVRTRSALYVLPGRHTAGTPAVRYRGIFINDEAPALSGWTRQVNGGFNHLLYERVFELVLRMKGNYLWPAMWGSAFNEDDSLNNVLADDYGVVMGNSHHEPMMRAQQEWRRHGTGQWNYDTNADVLRAFWRQGIVNMGSHESIVTVGMRGDGDMPMSRDNNIGLLERIVRDQRAIIGEVTGRDPSATPQLWALYKEVQGYYDAGMRVPDDVTLLFADDNWGNIRRLPAPGAAPRAGGYGVYYHFDYVGGPRNYKWINTNQIARVWEQMHLAYANGVDRIWIVNVGDIKPMEFPISFFLDYAWSPGRWPAESLPSYVRRWATQQFGPEHAPAIAELLTGYTRYNARRKPELLAPTTFSLNNYREAETVVADWQRLVREADRINALLPADTRDAFYQLVRHPILASANLNELYLAAARNRQFAAQGRARANDEADRVARLFARDAEITRFFNDTLAGGKWPHMMDQTHIGYRIWQEPRENSAPETRRVSLPQAADLGVGIEGTDRWWPQDSAPAILPEFDAYRQPSYYVDVFNRGQEGFDFEARTVEPWLVVTPARGRVEKEQRLEVTVDWRRVPAGRRNGTLEIVGAGKRVQILAPVNNPASPRRDQVRGFVEGGGYVSMEAEHYSTTGNGERGTGEAVRWVRIPDFGRTQSGMTTAPVTAPRQTPGGDSPHLEYQVLLVDSGEVNVRAYISPTLDFHAAGLSYAVSFDDQPPQIVNVVADSSLRTWERWVSDNANTSGTRHAVSAGQHVLKFWMVDPAVVLQKLVIERGEIRPSYLGPPESYRRP